MTDAQLQRAAGSRRIPPWLWHALAVAIPTAVFVTVLLSADHGFSYLYGDSQYYYYTAVSLLEDRDLDLGNQLPAPLERHSGDVSLDRHGRLVPKHPVVLAAVAAPLIGGLGRSGALIFNLVQLAALFWLMSVVSAREAAPWVAVTAASLTAVFSIFPMYAWNFSPDVFSCLMLSAALVALPPRPGRSRIRHAAAGLFFALAAVSKFSLVLAAIGAPLLCKRPWRTNLPAMAAGGSIPLALWMGLNLALFGSPLTTSYDRMAVLEGGLPRVASQRSDVDPARLVWRGMRDQLIDREQGLITTSPITLVSLLGLMPLARRHRSLAVYLGATCIILYLFFASYEWWRASHYGNRFLMPMMVLAIIPLTVLMDTAIGRLRHDRTGGG